MDAGTFRIWAKHRRFDALIEDAMIAATAQRHGLQVVTGCPHPQPVDASPMATPSVSQQAPRNYHDRGSEPHSVPIHNA